MPPENKRESKASYVATPEPASPIKPPFRFSKVELSASDKEALRAMRWESGELWDEMVELTHIGYKVSLSYDEQHHTYVASMTCKSPLRIDFNCCMTSRHSTPTGAVATMLYKWSVILGATALPSGSQETIGDIWD